MRIALFFCVTVFCVLYVQGWTVEEKKNAAELGIDLPSGRAAFIRNGENAQRIHWRFIVPIFQLAGGRVAHICGGSIIHPQWVLTAAHCFRKQIRNPRGKVVKVEMDLDRRGYKLHVGDYDIASMRDGAVVWPIDRIIAHQRYKGIVNNDPFDIALIKLKKPLPLGPNNKLVTRVQLPSPTLQFDSGAFTKCFAAGWGLMDTEPRKKATLLQQMEARALAQVACLRFWGDAKAGGYLHPVNMCLGNGMKSQCRGDSGGPAVCPVNNNFVLAGIMSFGSDDCDSKPGVLLKIPPFINWISEETGIKAQVLVGK